MRSLTVFLIEQRKVENSIYSLGFFLFLCSFFDSETKSVINVTKATKGIKNSRLEKEGVKTIIKIISHARTALRACQRAVTKVTKTSGLEFFVFLRF